MQKIDERTTTTTTTTTTTITFLLCYLVYPLNVLIATCNIRRSSEFVSLILLVSSSLLDQHQSFMNVRTVSSFCASTSTVRYQHYHFISSTSWKSSVHRFFHQRKIGTPTTFDCSFVYYNRLQQQQQQYFVCTTSIRNIPSIETTTGTTSTTRILSTMSSSSVPTPTTVLPQLPLRYENNNNNENENDTVFDLSDISNKLLIDEQKRQVAMDASRKLLAILIQIRKTIGTDTAQQLLKDIQTNPLFTPYLYNSEANSEDVTGSDNTTSEQAVVDSETTTNSDTMDVTTTSESTIIIQHIPRDGNWEYRIEEYVRLLAYQYFLQTGTLLPMSLIPFQITDDEYIMGVCIGLCTDLASSYGIGRATVRDVASVQLATQLVQAINEYLLQLDFRNGPIRRRYDSIKYSVKDLETLLYELAVTGTPPILQLSNIDDSTTVTSNQQQPSSSSHSSGLKRHKSNNNNERSSQRTVTTTTTTVIPLSPLLPGHELYQIAERMKVRDEIRESLIKKCRDGQKFAKNTIFALHRGDSTGATKLLDDCKNTIITDLLPLIQRDLSLRTSGSVSAVIEEYVEAKLFALWLNGINTNSNSNMDDNSTEQQQQQQQDGGIVVSVASINDLGLASYGFDIGIDEYLGGVCDLTGEIGRYAVARGTVRDVNAVRFCLQTNSDIVSAIQTIERLPSSVYKKVETVRRSVTKLHRMLYEISLSEATGRNIRTDITQSEPMDDE